MLSEVVTIQQCYMPKKRFVFCADGICIESNEIEVDESAMTGESDMMKKASYKDS
jgi:magnesium-transporting ATPase (P-type)